MASADRSPWTRRGALTLLGLAGAASVAGCGRGRSPAAKAADATTASTGTTTTSARATATGQATMRTIPYGKDRSQFADLYLPASATGKLPVAVVIHGGYWGSAYGNDLGSPLAEDLAGRGIAALNIEYRRIGIGGGWPGTFADAATAMDSLATLGQHAAGGRLDLGNVVVIGHSAGGHLAGWLAGRHTLTAGAVGAAPVVNPVGYVAQAGVLDLVSGFEQNLGGGAVAALMGGSPQQYPDRYAVGSPLALLPYGIPGTLVHGLADDVVPIQQSDEFAARATKVGDQVHEIRLPGVDHFMLIDPSTPAWAACRSAALGYLRS
jgi:acetyl esterase/lipase